jgi:hypothetical protein
LQHNLSAVCIWRGDVVRGIKVTNVRRIDAHLAISTYECTACSSKEKNYLWKFPSPHLGIRSHLTALPRPLSSLSRIFRFHFGTDFEYVLLKECWATIPIGCKKAQHNLEVSTSNWSSLVKADLNIFVSEWLKKVLHAVVHFKDIFLYNCFANLIDLHEGYILTTSGKKSEGLPYY